MIKISIDNLPSLSFCSDFDLAMAKIKKMNIWQKWLYYWHAPMDLDIPLQFYSKGFKSYFEISFIAILQIHCHTYIVSYTN